MKTFWVVNRVVKDSPEQFSDIASAISDAKRRQSADNHNQYAVMEAVLVTKGPVPDIEVEPLDAPVLSSQS